MKRIFLCTILPSILFFAKADSCSSAFSDLYKSLDLLSNARIEKSNLNNLSPIFTQLRYDAQAIESECIEDSVEVFQITTEWYPDCETSLSLLEEIADEYHTDSQKQKISNSEAITRLGQVLAVIPKIERTCGLPPASTMREQREEDPSNNQENFMNRVHRQENVEEEMGFVHGDEKEEEEAKMKTEDDANFAEAVRELQEAVLIID